MEGFWFNFENYFSWDVKRVDRILTFLRMNKLKKKNKTNRNVLPFIVCSKTIVKPIAIHLNRCCIVIFLSSVIVFDCMIYLYDTFNWIFFFFLEFDFLHFTLCLKYTNLNRKSVLHSTLLYMSICKVVECACAHYAFNIYALIELLFCASDFLSLSKFSTFFFLSSFIFNSIHWRGGCMCTMPICPKYIFLSFAIIETKNQKTKEEPEFFFNWFISPFTYTQTHTHNYFINCFSFN